MLLNDEIFMTVIKSTPLVSINLLITNELGNVLLGERLNQPAKKTGLFQEDEFARTSIWMKHLNG
jgi:hypothetical protein